MTTLETPSPEIPPSEAQHHIAVLTSEAGNAFVFHPDKIKTQDKEDGTHVRRLGTPGISAALAEETSPDGQRSYTYDFPPFWNKGAIPNSVPLTATDRWQEGGSSIERTYNTENPQSIADFEKNYPPLVGATWGSINAIFRGTQDQSRLSPELQRRPSLIGRVKAQLGRWTTRAN